MPDRPEPFRFEGFDTPRYTQVPDQLFDQLLPILSGAELKVLLYIMRRTFGFKKDADAISLSQICDGITKRNGERLDGGTGLHHKTAIGALRSLEEMEIIRAVRSRSPKGGFEPTTYSLNLRAKSAMPRESKAHPPGATSAIQETAQETDEQEDSGAPLAFRRLGADLEHATREPWSRDRWAQELADFAAARDLDADRLAFAVRRALGSLGTRPKRADFWQVLAALSG